jgi:hypothetical protein
MSPSRVAPTYIEESLSYEKTCFKICLKLISHKDTEFMIAPLSEKNTLKMRVWGFLSRLITVGLRLPITFITIMLN